MYPKILELSDAKLTVREVERDSDGALFLRLKGFSFHSSLAVDEVSVGQRKGRPLVLIRLVPARKGKDGNFDVRVHVATERETVLFGEQGQPVWPVGD